MATKHVIAYVMHVAERDLAARQVENAQVTDSYVIGDIDEERIQEFEGAGLVVDEVAPAGRPTTNAMARGTMSAERGTRGWRLRTFAICLQLPVRQGHRHTRISRLSHLRQLAECQS
jgi:hypothetical protein